MYDRFHIQIIDNIINSNIAENADHVRKTRMILESRNELEIKIMW